MGCVKCGTDGALNEAGLCADCAAGTGSGTSDSGSDVDVGAVDIKSSLDTAKQEVLAAFEHRKPDSYRIVQEFGQCDEVQLRLPFSVTIDDNGNVFVLDCPSREEYRVVQFKPDGEFERAMMVCRQGSEPGALQYPKGIAIDRSGNVFIPDAGNDRIQIFDNTGKLLRCLGQRGEAPGEFNYPCDVEVDGNGALYVADTENSRIQKLTAQGMALLEIGGYPEDPDEDPLLDEPLGVMVDEQRRIFVADTNHDRVVVFDAEGKELFSFGESGRGAGEFDGPSDLRVTDDGLIYVADQDNGRVQKFRPDGSFVAEFKLDAVDNELAVEGGDIAIDDDGCVYMCVTHKHTVVRIELLEKVEETSGEPL